MFLALTRPPCFTTASTRSHVLRPSVCVSTCRRSPTLTAKKTRAAASASAAAAFRGVGRRPGAADGPRQLEQHPADAVVEAAAAVMDDVTAGLSSTVAQRRCISCRTSTESPGRHTKLPGAFFDLRIETIWYFSGRCRDSRNCQSTVYRRYFLSDSVKFGITRFHKVGGLISENRQKCADGFATEGQSKPNTAHQGFRRQRALAAHGRQRRRRRHGNMT